MKKALLFLLLSGACATAQQYVPRNVIIGNTVYPRVSGTYRALGDSITVGLGASTGSSYVSLIVAATGWQVTNLGVSGEQITDFAADAILPLTVASGDAATILPGYNDMRATGSDATGKLTYERALRASLVWLATPTASIIKGGDSGWATTGSWTVGTLYGQSALNRYTSTNGATIQRTVYGTAIYFGYTIRKGLGDGGTFTVSVDGNVVATLDANVGTRPILTNRAYWPEAIRIGNLDEGPHTLLITTTSAGTVNVDWVVTNEKAHDPAYPKVFCGNTMRMNATGYAGGSPFNLGSDDVVNQFNVINKTVVSSLTDDGFNVCLVPVSLDYNPNATPAETDENVHPNNLGHSNIATAFLRSINGLVQPWSLQRPAGTQMTGRMLIGETWYYSHDTAGTLSWTTTP
jgi:hypothetical protein